MPWPEGGAAPSVAVLYHYMHPDDVVSARHFDGLCLGLVERGWNVEAVPCNRGCRDESPRFPLREEWRGIRFHRAWRPPFRQATHVGRAANSACMLSAWSARAVGRRNRRPDVLLIGTDPPFGLAAAIPWKALHPRVAVAHWAFDLHPESLFAEGLLRERRLPGRLLSALMRAAYARCDLVADLGPCMRERLAAAGVRARQVTLVPWALVEPELPPSPDPSVRAELFGGARLGLLYSGSFSRAHAFGDILGLARALRGDGVHFCFAVRGNGVDELRAALRPDDANVSLAGFAPESELRVRLPAADVHLASLDIGWTGIMVPSKFFGSLACGRPVVFAGPGDASIARWVRELGTGWVLDAKSQGEVAAALRRLANAPEELRTLQARCHAAYQDRFSRRRTLDGWDAALRALLRRPKPAEAADPVPAAATK